MDKILQIRLALDEAITYGDIEKAKKLAEKGLSLARLEENSGESEYFSGQIDILHEDYSKAIEHFDIAIKYNPKDGASYNDRALCMIELGVIENAFTYLNKGIEVEPDFATIHHNKGWLFSKMGGYKEAIDCFKKALELDPNRAVTCENLANAYLNLDDTNMALEYYKKAVSLLKPGHSNIKKQLMKQIKMLE